MVHIFLVLLTGCAKVGAPRGGEADRLPPRIIEHVPAADAIGVELDARVEIVFSEGMERTATQDAIFLAPELEVRYRWRGRRLALEAGAGLSANRTYVVTVGTGARDLRGNPLEQSFTFAFATGDRINQGRIRGHVFKDHQPLGGVHVWAYDLEGFTGTVGADAPQYRTQSGGDGAYEFSWLSPGRYRIMAFVDENRNRRYGEGEWLALAAEDLRVEEGGEARCGDLALFRTPGTAPRLQRVQALNQERVLLYFSAEVEAKEVEVEFDGLGVQGLHGGPGDGRKIYILTAPQEAGRAYPFAELKVGGQPLDWEEPVRGSGRPDRTPPALYGQFPRGGKVAASDTLRLVYGEAMRQVEPEDFWIESDSTRSLEGSWYWEDWTGAAFVPTPSLQPGAYSLRGRGEMFEDLSGLSPGDSLVVFEFEVLGELEMGSLAGSAQEGDAWVVAWHRGHERSYRARADSAGNYLLEGLLPGSYTVHAFVDLNGNDVLDPGRLDPPRAAEPYSLFPQAVHLDEGESATGIDLRFR